MSGAEYDKMKANVKKRWVEALRSGEYGQAKGALARRGRSFCCLGVLCDIEIDGYWEKPDAYSPWALELDRWEIGGEDSMPPRYLLDRVGLDIGAANELADRNDEGWSFERIATWIEKNL